MSEITDAVMSGGYCCWNMVGWQADSSPIMVPLLCGLRHHTRQHNLAIPRQAPCNKLAVMLTLIVLYACPLLLIVGGRCGRNILPLAVYEGVCCKVRVDPFPLAVLGMHGRVFL
jgi:hypothetical protein